MSVCGLCGTEFDGTSDYWGNPLRGGSRRHYCSRRCRQDRRNALAAATRTYKPRPRTVDDIAVERACNGDANVKLNRAELAEVFRILYARGLSASVIAKRIGVSHRTAERHRPERAPKKPPPARKDIPAMPADTWSVNRLTARAVALHAHGTADARLLLEMLGLIEPGGHTLLPDDTRNYDVDGAAPDSGSTIGWRQVAPEPRADRSNVPAGLREAS